MGLTAYFHSRQYRPFERMREMYRDIFSLDISVGSLVNMIHRFSGKAGKLYEIIRTAMKNIAGQRIPIRPKPFLAPTASLNCYRR
jgi:hypothetical protein